jgi:hypothetical protein
MARKFLRGILEHPEVKPLLSDDLFTVDGPLINAWPSLKSFVPKADTPDGGGAPPGGEGERSPSPAPDAATSKDNAAPDKTQSNTRIAPMPSPESTAKSRNEEVDFHGTKRSNATHASTTDAEARLFRKGKGKEARLSYMGHALAENRHGLVVEAGLTQATGTAEREAAKDLIESHSPGSERRLTLGARQGLRHARPSSPTAAPCA